MFSLLFLQRINAAIRLKIKVLMNMRLQLRNFPWQFLATRACLFTEFALPPAVASPAMRYYGMGPLQLGYKHKLFSTVAHQPAVPTQRN